MTAIFKEKKCEYKLDSHDILLLLDVDVSEYKLDSHDILLLLDVNIIEAIEREIERDSR